MNCVLVVPPVIEPVTLAEAKLQLNYDGGSFSDQVDQTQSLAPGLKTFVDNWTTWIGAWVEVLGYNAVISFAAGAFTGLGTVDMRIQDTEDKITITTFGTDFTQVATLGMTTTAALAIGTTLTNVAYGLFSYFVAGVGYSKPALAAGVAPGTAVTVPQNKYGAVAFDIDALNAILAVESAGNGAGTYTTALAASNALPAAGAGYVRMGYVTVMSTAIAGFIFGTTKLNDTGTTVAYTSTAIKANYGATYEKAYTGVKRYVRTIAKVLVADCSFGTSVIRSQASAVEDDLLNELITTARLDVENDTARAIMTQTWDYFPKDWPAGDRIKIPWGNLQSVTSVKWKDTDGVETNLTKTLTAFAASSITPLTKTKVTCAAHGFDEGDTVYIDGTTSYDGAWVVSNVTTNTFDITMVFVADDATGTATEDYIVETNGDQCGFVVLPDGGSWPSDSLYPSNPICIRFVAGYGATAASVPSTIKQAIKRRCVNLHANRGDDVVGQTVSEDKTYSRLINAVPKLWDQDFL